MNSAPERLEAARTSASAFDVDVDPIAVARRTAVTLLAQMLLKVRGLIVVPIFAHLLGPGGMGVLGLAVALAGLTLPLLTAGLHSGLWVQLTYLRERQLASRAHSTALLSAGVTSVVGGLLFGMALYVSGDVAAIAPLQPYVPPVATLLVFSALREISVVFPQMRQEMTYLARLSLAVDYGGAAVGIALVLLGGDVSAVLWALALAHGAATGAATARTVRACGGLPGIDPALLRDALRLGLPSLPMAASQWAQQSAHAFFLAAYYGEAVVGLAAVAYTVASAVLILTGALNLVFFPTATAVWNRDRAGFARLLDRCLRWTAVAAVFLAANAQLLSEWALPRLLGVRFGPTAALAPALVTAFGFVVLAQVLQFVSVIVSRRTGAVSLIHAAMSVIHIAVSLLLIPGHSLAGAGAGTLVSSSLGLVAALALARASLPEIAGTSLARPALLALVAMPLALWATPRFSDPLAAVVAWAVAMNAVLVALAAGVGAVDTSDARLLRAGLASSRPPAASAPGSRRG